VAAAEDAPLEAAAEPVDDARAEAGSAVLLDEMLNWGV